MAEFVVAIEAPLYICQLKWSSANWIKHIPAGGRSERQRAAAEIEHLGRHAFIDRVYAIVVETGHVGDHRMWVGARQSYQLDDMVSLFFDERPDTLVEQVRARLHFARGRFK